MPIADSQVVTTRSSLMILYPPGTEVVREGVGFKLEVPKADWSTSPQLFDANHSLDTARNFATSSVGSRTMRGTLSI